MIYIKHLFPVLTQHTVYVITNTNNIISWKGVKVKEEKDKVGHPTKPPIHIYGILSFIVYMFREMFSQKKRREKKENRQQTE